MIRYRDGYFILTIDGYRMEVVARSGVIYDLKTIFERLFDFKDGDTVQDFEFFWDTTTKMISVTLDNLNIEEFFIYLENKRLVFNFYELAKELAYDIMRDINKLVYSEVERYNPLFDIEYNAIEFDKEYHDDLISFVNFLKFAIKEYEVKNGL